jgi:hypothetical protein
VLIEIGIVASFNLCLNIKHNRLIDTNTQYATGRPVRSWHCLYQLRYLSTKEPKHNSATDYITFIRIDCKALGKVRHGEEKVNIEVYSIYHSINSLANTTNRVATV